MCFASSLTLCWLSDPLTSHAPMRAERLSMDLGLVSSATLERAGVASVCLFALLSYPIYLNPNIGGKIYGNRCRVNAAHARCSSHGLRTEPSRERADGHVRVRTTLPAVEN